MAKVHGESRARKRFESVADSPKHAIIIENGDLFDSAAHKEYEEERVDDAFADNHIAMHISVRKHID